MRVRVAAGGWRTHVVETSVPLEHLTNQRGERIDLDAMLRRLHLMSTDFDGAPSHHKAKAARDPRFCRHGHPWSENAYVIPATRTRICIACKDEARQRKRDQEK